MVQGAVIYVEGSRTSQRIVGHTLICRFIGGIHNESYDEEAAHGVIFALRGGDTPVAVLSETLPSTTELSMEGTLDSPHYTIKVPSC